MCLMWRYLSLYFIISLAILISFALEEVHNQPLTRLCSESVRIHNNNCKIPMNSKAEWHQPAVARALVTMELDELKVQGDPGR